MLKLVLRLSLIIGCLITRISCEIVLEPDEAELEVTSGADFILKCTGDQNVRWSYPTSQPDHSSKMSLKTVKYYETGDGKFSADLHIQRAHYMDTGFYECSYANMTEQKDIYLFVRDAENLLAVDNSDGHIIINQNQYEDLIIPCRPTSTDINVTLYRDSSPVQSQFDWRKGFIIKEPMMTDSGYYDCIAARRHASQTVEFVVNIYPKTEMVAKPIITVEGYEKGHVVVGQDIILVCDIIFTPGEQITLDWEIPEHVNLEKVSFSNVFTEKIHIRGIERRRSSRNLQIKNVSKDDEGQFTCRVSDRSMNTNQEQYELKVFPTDMKYLNVTMQGKSEIQVRVSERVAQWIVHFEAYPAPIIEWYGPDNTTLPRTDKYTIIIDSTKTKITVHNLTIEDSGVYSLHASNTVKNVTLNVTLLVEDKPRVLFKPTLKSYYDINKEELIECIITAYPMPTVTWDFTECTDHDSFCAPGYQMPPVPMEPKPLESRGIVRWVSQVRWYARESGVISCKASNYLGSSQASIHFKVTDVNNGFDIWGPKHRVLSSESITLGCGASIYAYEPKIDWIYKTLNDPLSKPEILTNSSRKGITITYNKTSFSYETNLYLENISVENSGVFKCRVKSFIEKEFKEKEFKLLVQGRKDVGFTNYTNLNGSTKTLLLGRPISFNCSVNGVPEPEIVWFKDSKALVPKNNRVYLENRNQTLHILYTEYEDAGVYKCEASNGPGTLISASSTLKLKGPGMPSRVLMWVFILLVVSVVGLLVVVWFGFRKYKREQKKRKELISVGLYNFSQGAIESIDPNLDIGEQAELLPYDKKWEFPREKLKLGKQLGSGAFGVVYKGEALGLIEEGVPTTVAVKMVKQSSDIAHVKALATELKIMAHLGQNLNVVNLLGACTGNVHKRELFVLVEYCKYGNLHKYLLHHRNTFINQIDPATGTVDFSDSKDPVELTYINSSNYRASSAVNSDYSNGQSVRTEMTSISTPVGDDGYLMNRDLLTNYVGDYKPSSIRPICTRDLFCWSWQVAKGMDYLASRKVLHGDLAARNILLAEGNIVKISDFGLAKSLYSKENYQKKKRDVPLPVKWMSIESIRDGIFSVQSDIWSFGVFLWEMFSLAVTPYPGLYGEQFYNKLLQGYRMEKPKFATEDVYNLMLECWKEQPMLRPTFTECSDRLGFMLEDSVKDHYLELNSPYMEKNTSLTSENDHLSKLVAPTYENCLLSGISDPSPADGYVCMKPPKTDALNEMELSPMITPGSNSFLNPGYQELKIFSEHNYLNLSEDTTSEPPVEESA